MTTFYETDETDETVGYSQSTKLRSIKVNFL